MKKILLVSQAMEIGGADKALLGLLEAIDKKIFQVDLFLLRHTGELLKYIPDNIGTFIDSRLLCSNEDLDIPIPRGYDRGYGQ